MLVWILIRGRQATGARDRPPHERGTREKETWDKIFVSSFFLRLLRSSQPRIGFHVSCFPTSVVSYVHASSGNASQWRHTQGRVTPHFGLHPVSIPPPYVIAADDRSSNPEKPNLVGGQRAITLWGMVERADGQALRCSHVQGAARLSSPSRYS